MKTPTILSRNHPSLLGPLQLAGPLPSAPPAKPFGRWTCTTHFQGITMLQPSAFFIGHQGINLPHGLRPQNLPKESEKRRNAMIWQRYTLCE
jgi:hypothetical protein